MPYHSLEPSHILHKTLWKDQRLMKVHHNKVPQKVHKRHEVIDNVANDKNMKESSMKANEEKKTITSNIHIFKMYNKECM